MNDMRPIRRALISVSDKSGLGEFAKGLVKHGTEILSTGGTARMLEKEGLPVTLVEDVTGFPEIFGGRVKTLHPLVHGGILWRRDNEQDILQAKAQNINEIDLVGVVLYKFEEAAAKAGLSPAQIVEEIDIGGPTMLRAAAKNHAWVASVSSPDQYADILSELDSKGGLSLKTRKSLAQATFARTAAYDKAIRQWFESEDVKIS